MSNLLITGDSLSYNRYGYDEIPRVDSWDCHIGMGSWSFHLCRDYISSAESFKYGDELKIKEEVIYGLGEDCEETDSLFGKRVVTVKPENGMIHIAFSCDSGKIVIYFQSRPKNYCRFDISVDGVCRHKAVETFGHPHYYHGFSPVVYELECEKSRTEHEIVLSGFDGPEGEPYVTVAGAAGEKRCAYITGQGSRTAKFLLYHFEERIAQKSPDTMVLILGGNDYMNYSEDEYRIYLSEIFKRLYERFPKCRLITVTIPPQAKCLEEIRGEKIRSDADLNAIVDRYNAVFREVSEKNGAECINMKELFKDISPEVWRFDNVHLSNKGNDILYNEIKKHILM